ncbi:hypothetical protein ZIOFF_069917 [Zingiber officinale]|uniref:Uncharacterized protein n=1 Tax=Zingiber officinale TaxID=94328 RepID=A0A8J5C4G7_ZINOF|nr:hypothetical protein ZIOFF_069917 [Zingiber officinale]
MEVDDSFKRPGSISFKWEVQPGVPKQKNIIGPDSPQKLCLPPVLCAISLPHSPALFPPPPLMIGRTNEGKAVKVFAMLRRLSMSNHFASVRGRHSMRHDEFEESSSSLALSDASSVRSQDLDA